VGFFDHMLDQLARHALIDLTIKARGDLHIDDHHTVEDVGITLGQALAAALGDKRGIRRYGAFTLVMDEARVRRRARPVGAALPCLGRGLPHAQDRQLRHRTRARVLSGAVHPWRHHAACRSVRGVNSHHIAEAAFKAVARACAWRWNPTRAGRCDALDQGRALSMTRHRRLRLRQSAFGGKGVSAHGRRNRRGPVAVTGDPDQVARADRIVLPGDGAFPPAAGAEILPGLFEAVIDAAIARARPFLGICVGMQMLADGAANTRMWRALAGSAGGRAHHARRPGPEGPAHGLERPEDRPPHPFSTGFRRAHAYFVHSYAMRRPMPPLWLATSDYGGPSPPSSHGTPSSAPSSTPRKARPRACG
jgi:imidazoleglycerol-phosphate dehydratase